MTQSAATDLTIVMSRASLARAVLHGEHLGLSIMGGERVTVQLRSMAGIVGNHAEHDEHRQDDELPDRSPRGCRIFGRAQHCGLTQGEA